jgi:hypothetical protein
VSVRSLWVPFPVPVSRARGTVNNYILTRLRGYQSTSPSSESSKYLCLESPPSLLRRLRLFCEPQAVIEDLKDTSDYVPVSSKPLRQALAAIDITDGRFAMGTKADVDEALFAMLAQIHREHVNPRIQ